jgi:hypothetical protein
MLAGIGVGLWDRGALTRLAAVDRTFQTACAPDVRAARLARYRAAVAAAVTLGS